MTSSTIRARVLALLAALALAPASFAQPLASSPASPAAQPKRPTTVIPREGCVTAECHPGVKAHAVLHGPVHANACDSCHRLKDPAAHTFEPSRSRADMCTLCHAVEAPRGAHVHKPFAEGECLACHDPHGSNEPAILRGDRYSDACKACHQDVTGAHDRVHGPAAAGACGACHQPHASRHAKLLNADGRELCLTCHVNVATQIQTRAVVHKPVLGDCAVCHTPHATDRPGLLVADPATLCTGCHQDIARTIGDATSQHGAITTQRSCVNCHAPHASDQARLLRNDEKTLCLECHNTPIKLPDGSKLLNMQEVLERGTSLHGAIADRSCSVCHQIHGSSHRRLLTSEYPSDLYYPFSDSAYALCFSCHDKQLVALKSTDATTAFRNGDRNLHFAHVNRDDKGRSCKVCHDAHASSSERHIRTEIPFGAKGWKLPIKYERLESGGKCGPGCHGALEYNRDHPIVYPASVKGGAWKGTDLVPGVPAVPAPPAPPAPSAPPVSPDAAPDAAPRTPNP